MSRRDQNLAGSALAGGVRVYQYVVRPMIGGGQCRYVPCCSDYAIQALRRHGAARGSLLATRRILRCNPWMPGGDDPVPPPPSQHGPNARTPA